MGNVRNESPCETVHWLDRLQGEPIGVV